jgi:peptide chain release factor
MKKKILQITAGRGPIEFCRVVAMVQQKILQDAEKRGITVEVLDDALGEKTGTYKSVTLVMSGGNYTP